MRDTQRHANTPTPQHMGWSLRPDDPIDSLSWDYRTLKPYSVRRKMIIESENNVSYFLAQPPSFDAVVSHGVAATATCRIESSRLQGAIREARVLYLSKLLSDLGAHTACRFFF